MLSAVPSPVVLAALTERNPNAPLSQDTCSGHNGGPVLRTTPPYGGTNTTYLLGVVSFGPDNYCSKTTWGG